MYSLLYLICVLLVCRISTSDVIIKRVNSPRSPHGEGPHWDERTQSLYYVNINGLNQTILRYDFNENITYTAIVDGLPLITFILPVEGTTDEFLVGTKHSAQVIRWDGKTSNGKFVRTVFEIEENISTNRFNDGKSDPRGRFVGGTMRLSECDSFSKTLNASLFSYEKGSGIKSLRNDVAISNGLTWISMQSGYKFYYIDSCTHDIIAFDYNINTGEIANKTIAFTIKTNGQAPNYVFDGMTSDLDGNLYIATFGGGRVLKVNPIVGKILAEYRIPFVDQITSVAFGGPKLDIIFVTTAAKGNQSSAAEAGYLYQIIGAGVGLPAIKVNV